MVWKENAWTTRGEAEIVEQKSGTFQIVITSIPYRVNKANLIESIATLIQEKKLEGVKGLRDESTKDIRVVTHELTPLPASIEDSSKRFVYYYSNS